MTDDAARVKNDGARNADSRLSPEVPPRPVLGALKHQNRVVSGSSPTLSSPVGSASGKLIRMFEDMSRAERAKAAKRAGSPEPIGKAGFGAGNDKMGLLDGGNDFDDGDVADQSADPAAGGVLLEG